MAYQLNPLTSLSAKGDTLYIDTDWEKGVIYNAEEKRYEFTIYSPDMPKFRKAMKGRHKMIMRNNGKEYQVTCVIIFAGGACELLMENIT